MSIATISATMNRAIPADELIGSLTKERIRLCVQYAGSESTGTDGLEAERWLAYALNTDIPRSLFMQVMMAYSDRAHLEDCDLDYWYDVPNTHENRVAMLETADATRGYAVETLTVRLCTLLGVR